MDVREIDALRVRSNRYIPKLRDRPPAFRGNTIEGPTIRLSTPVRLWRARTTRCPWGAAVKRGVVDGTRVGRCRPRSNLFKNRIRRNIWRDDTIAEDHTVGWRRRFGGCRSCCAFARPTEPYGEDGFISTGVLSGDEVREAQRCEPQPTLVGYVGEDDRAASAAGGGKPLHVSYLSSSLVGLSNAFSCLIAASEAMTEAHRRTAQHEIVGAFRGPPDEGCRPSFCGIGGLSHGPPSCWKALTWWPASTTTLVLQSTTFETNNGATFISARTSHV